MSGFEVCDEHQSFARGSLEVKRRHFEFRYTSATHFLEFFRTCYGPTLKAFEALDVRQQSLARGIEVLAQQFNRSSDGSLVFPAEYLEIVAVKA